MTDADHAAGSACERVLAEMGDLQKRAARLDPDSPEWETVWLAWQHALVRAVRALGADRPETEG